MNTSLTCYGKLFIYIENFCEPQRVVFAFPVLVSLFAEADEYVDDQHAES